MRGGAWILMGSTSHARGGGVVWAGCCVQLDAYEAEGGGGGGVSGVFFVCLAAEGIGDWSGAGEWKRILFGSF